jgi:serine/threonine-protein kinase HipA
MAIAIRGRSAQYRMMEITARHWEMLADTSGLRQVWQKMQEMAESAMPSFERLEGRLPSKFPERVYRIIRKGIQAQIRRFAQTRVDVK